MGITNRNVIVVFYIGVQFVGMVWFVREQKVKQNRAEIFEMDDVLVPGGSGKCPNTYMFKRFCLVRL